MPDPTQFTLTIEESREVPEAPDTLVVNISRLSRKTGYSVSHLSRVFSQETCPSVDCLGKLGEVLGLRIDKLLDMIREGRIGTKNSQE
jgi:AraC-like DNA-binding protein